MSDIEMAMKDIIATIGEKISTKALDDSEEIFIGKLLEMEQQNESVGSLMRLSMLASLLSISSFLPAAQLNKNLKDAQQASIQNGQPFRANSPIVKDAIKKSAKDNEMLGSMSKTNVMNVVA